MPIQSFDELLQLQSESEDSFSAPASPDKGERMFGGQFLAQAIAAASRTVDPSRAIHSLHAYFLRPGDTELAVRYEVDHVRDGRSYSHRQVSALQQGKQLFTMLASWCVPTRSPEYFGSSMEDVPPPSECDYTYEDFCRDQMPDPEYETTVKTRPMDILYINPPRTREVGNHVPNQLMWMKISVPVSPNPSVQHSALAYLSDSTIIDHIVLPFGKRWRDEDFEGTSLDHAMWFHGDCRADQWILFEQAVEWTGIGRGFTTGKMFDQTGRLIASIAQEGLMRFTTP